MKELRTNENEVDDKALFETHALNIVVEWVGIPRTSYSVGLGFRSELADRISLLRFFMVFLTLVGKLQDNTPN
jgi:hypothetical protein